MDIIAGKAPNTFRQERLKIVFEDSISIQRDFRDLLNGLLEPLPEERISARIALNILNHEIPPRAGTLTTSRSRQSKQPAGSRVILKRVNSGLQVDIPPSGLTGNP